MTRSVTLQVDTGSTLTLFSDSRSIAATSVDDAAWARAFDLPAGLEYVRAELASATGEILALTNPVWAEQL